MPTVVQCCLQRMYQLHESWSIHVLTEASESTEGFAALSVQAKSDWVRLCALQRGGVWLDASCICAQSVDNWVDMTADAVQGFSAPFAADTLESWAFAAPPGHPLLIRWKQIFGEAIRIGFPAFKSSVPDYIQNHTIYGHMPYLTIHACYLMAAQETGMRAALTPSCNGPFRYLCDRDFDSRRAMKALMHKPLVDPPPLIKLRGAETNVTKSITCKHGSFMSSVGMPVGDETQVRILLLVAGAIAVLGALLSVGVAWRRRS